MKAKKTKVRYFFNNIHEDDFIVYSCLFDYKVNEDVKDIYVKII